MGKRLFPVLLALTCCIAGLWLLRSPEHPTIAIVSQWLMRIWPVLIILAGLVRIGNYLIDRHPTSPIGGFLLTALGGILLAMQLRGESFSLLLLGRYWFWVLLAYVLGRVLWQYTAQSANDFGFERKRPRFLTFGSATIMTIIVTSGLATNYAGRDNRFFNALSSRLGQLGTNMLGETIAVEDEAPQSFTLPANAQILINHWRGDVTVTEAATSQPRAKLTKRVRATTQEQARETAKGIQLQIRTTGNQLEFSTLTANFSQDYSASLTIELPAQAAASLRLDDVRGDVTLRGTRGEHSLRNCGGVTIFKQQGGLQISGIRGAVQIQETNGAVKLEDITRDVVIDNLTGALNLSARGGNHRLSDLTGVLVAELQNSRAEVRNVTAPNALQNDQPLVFFEEANNSRLQLSGVRGSTVINAKRTRIETESITGDLTIEGDADLINIAKHKGRLDINNENGEINVTDLTGAAEISTKRDVTIKNFAGPLKAETEFGTIVITNNAALRGDIVADSERGHLKINLPSDIAFRLDANTESGRIRTQGFNGLIAERRQTTLTANYNVTTTAPLVSLRTIRGNIELQATGQALRLEQLP